ncbi:hypothetical protein [Flavobacterium sp.]|uniref:hypothetical protein n=1 Tax=Flavobacterium sp. TaxID=239 RepID=UPI00286BEC7E|nr:hypothetical protein [Flavobacterium sp.]
MLKKITTLVYLMLCISCISQNTLADKKYKAEVSASCEKFKNGGGCMIYNFCILEFEKNIVKVSYITKAYCTPKEMENDYKNNVLQKTEYNYTIKNNVVNIKNFNTYGKLTIKQKKLIGQKEMNDNEFSKLEFLLQ